MNSITLPSGRISETGKREILSLLWNETGDNCIPALPDDFAWQMQVGGKGEYVGSLPKRIAKYYWQKFTVKLNSDFLGKIGSLASQHTTKIDEFTFDFTSEFNWDDGDFGDAGSCYWGCRSKARDLLSENGGQAIRFFNGEGGARHGFARAWIMPHQDGLVCFNGYGMELSQIAHILAFHRGESYRKIRLANNDSADGLIWINGGSGFLIGQESAINGASRFDLHIDSATCDNCGDFSAELTRVGNGNCLCESCMEEYDYCDDCQEYQRDCTNVDGRYVCESCLESYSMCEDCEEYHENTTEVSGERYVCDECLKNYTLCHDCNVYFSETQEVSGGHYVCNGCLENYSTCADCGEYVTETTEVNSGDYVCEDCLENYTENEDGEYTKTEVLCGT